MSSNIGGSIGCRCVDDPAQVEGGERQVAEEGREAERRVGVEVALADLDEAALGPQQAEARRDELARERVQHDVDAVAAGGGPDLVDEGEGPRVEDVLDAEGSQVRALLRVTGGGVDLGAQEPGDLYARRARRRRWRHG